MAILKKSIIILLDILLGVGIAWVLSSFLVNHILLFLSLAVSIIAVVYQSEVIRKAWFTWRSKIMFLLFIYVYLCFVLGTTITFGKIFNIISPISVEAVVGGETLSTITPFSSSKIPQSNLFPLSKTFGIRLWNDLPINRKPYPYLHYFVRSEFSLMRNQKLEHFKQIVCVLKNLGGRPIVIKGIESINVKRAGTAIADYSDTPGEWVVLKDVLNKYISTHAIVLFPSEEVPLFNIMRSSTYESLVIEIKVTYSEIHDENVVLTLLQKDKASFNNILWRIVPFPRTIDAKTTEHKPVL